MKKIICTISVFCFLFACNRGTENKIPLLERAEIPYLKGESRMVIDPKPAPDFDENEWYTNDHCFVTGHDGTLHWFGINNPYPPKGKSLYGYEHPYIGHLISTKPDKNWERLAFAFDEYESQGTERVGAPYVVWHEKSNRWIMVLSTYFDKRSGLEVCWSDDLCVWNRTKKRILEGTLQPSTRDPHIIKGKDGKYWIHMVSSGVEGRKNSQIIRLKTKDFEHFEKPQIIMEINGKRPAIESPFLVERNGLWYLFCTYAHRRYEETIVIVSDDPNHFDFKENCLTTLFGHASEIFTYNGKTYISSCGPEDRQSLNNHGVTLAELGWLSQKK